MKKWYPLIIFILKIALICCPFFIILFLLSGGLAILLELISIFFGETILIYLMSTFLVVFWTIYAFNYRKSKKGDDIYRGGQ